MYSVERKYVNFFSIANGFEKTRIFGLLNDDCMMNCLIVNESHDFSEPNVGGLSESIYDDSVDIETKTGNNKY